MRARSPVRRAAAVAVASAAALAATVTSLTADAAAVACEVNYAISSQWGGGFGANVTINNLGDPVNGWRLGWSFGAGQQVTQAWNATVTQSGAQVTAADAGYNASIPNGGNVSFGFNASWNNSSNPIPTSFTLNGVTCTGGTGPTATPTPTRRSPPP